MLFITQIVEIKRLTDKKKKEETSYTVPHNLHFLTAWIKFNIFYLYIFHKKKRGNLLIKGKLFISVTNK